MHRLFRLSLLVVLLTALMGSVGFAASNQAFVSGRVGPEDVRVFVKDSVYIIDRDYMIAGTLIIEPGTTVMFYPQGRIIDSVGGRIIADGDAQASYTPSSVVTKSNVQINPVEQMGTSPNPYSFDGYSDLRYFLYGMGYFNYFDGADNHSDAVVRGTSAEPTVNAAKHNHIYNVVLNIATRQIENLIDPMNPPMGPDRYVVPFEHAIMFMASRLYNDPILDQNLRDRPWRRIHDLTPNVSSGTIRFIGQPANNFSEEWGHIIVLPGARAAFFRNVEFDGIRKYENVDRFPLYKKASFPQLTQAEFDALMDRFINLTNGSGGAITTFSSRTWLVDATFRNNMARYKGGALQILQAPVGIPSMVDWNFYYPNDKNPNLVNRYGELSEINAANPIPMIDAIDEYWNEPMSDSYRQHYDDARIAVFLGRMRNLTFDHNKLMMAVLEKVTFDDGTEIVMFNKEKQAAYPQKYGNYTKGGAVYIAGNDTSEHRQMEIGFGINTSIRLSQGETISLGADELVVNENTAENFQGAFSSLGSRGGAFYIGRYTSMIVAGQFTGNEAHSKYLLNEFSGSNSGYYAMGGAIFCENTYGRLTVKGGPTRGENNTTFANNRAGAGGAIFVDGNTDLKPSPIIGGSDMTLETRDYGYDITFVNNSAYSFGGAIFTKRNAMINGGGGVDNDVLLGYGGKYPVIFDGNSAGYSGGAIDFHIPNSYSIQPEQRAVQMVRCSFIKNVVGQGIEGLDRDEIRGGGAIYALHADLNLNKAIEFRANEVINGNGAAICMVNPLTSNSRFFLTDLDEVYYDNGVAVNYSSTDDVFRWATDDYPADTRMLTRFLDNEVKYDDDILAKWSGSGTTQIGEGTMRITSNLYGAYFFDDTEGVVCGLNGTIAKVTQGGDKWTDKKLSLRNRLNAVYFTTTETGFVIGRDTDVQGTILKTTDGGDSWSVVWQDTDRRSLNAIKFIGTSTGYVVGENGLTLKTTDGGDTWYPFPIGEYNDLYDLYMTGTEEVYAVGEMGAIFKTTNGGQDWTGLVSNTLAQLNTVTFVNSSVGFAAGTMGIVVKTEDGGDSWTFVSPEDATATFNSMVFTSATTGYVAGTFGALYKTEDAGATWTMLDPMTTYSLYAMTFPTPSTGYIVGDAGLLLKTTDAGATWESKIAENESYVDQNRLHQEVMLPENGVGLGGAIYILDSTTINRVGRVDSVKFNRVRMQNNVAYTGAAIYSDNYDLKLIFNKSLITGNEAKSEIGMAQNHITGPILRQNDQASEPIRANFASSDLAGAIIYGEIQGPLPSYLYPEAANSIYDNKARFLIRLPDAPNTKGYYDGAGNTGIGFGGTDTLRGNYWGRTEANINFVVDNGHGYQGAIQETFFLENHLTAGNDVKYLDFLFWTNAADRPSDPLKQGPFESTYKFAYVDIPLANADGNENMHADNSMPEKLVMSGHVYDIHDKGTDIKTADYSKRRMAPIEDFAVGIPPIVKKFGYIYDNSANDGEIDAAYDQELPSFGKNIKRWARDPFVAEMKDDDGNLVYPHINKLQVEFLPNQEGELYHPIGYPLFLEAGVDYDGMDERTNKDLRLLNETVFFVINETTGDFIRTNLRQVDEEAPYNEVFRSRVDLVPDLTSRPANTQLRRTEEGLLNIGVNIGEPELLRNLYQNPSNEDRATLMGRRYYSHENDFGMAANLFSNRPDMPVSNEKDNVNYETFFAGERYRALPVNVGDIVRIVSRTSLWKEGVNTAFAQALTFEVSRSTVPPVFTGDVVKMQDTIVTIVPSKYPWKNKQGIMDTVKHTEWLNIVQVTEDREYPKPKGYYSEASERVGKDAVGRDSIVSVTAKDLNEFYDPRSYFAADEYAELYYDWFPVYGGTENPNYNAGIWQWLFVEKYPAGLDVPEVANPKDSALGYMIFRGRAINPYVVPGGEELMVTAHNFPPHYRTLDSLRVLLEDSLLTQDEFDQYYYTFMKYLHAPVYDYDYDLNQQVNDRYLNQDSIDIGINYIAKHRFKVLVNDSTPIFLNPDDRTDPEDDESPLVWPKDLTVDMDYRGEVVKTIGTYEPSDYPCLSNRGTNRLQANLTNKLRFQVDFNTDDELEDSWAAENWDFRYGKTTYGFLNRAMRSNDAGGNGEEDVTLEDVVIDELNYGDVNLIVQSRPIWMDNQFLFKYDSDTDVDEFGVDFSSKGQLNIRIDRDDALNIIDPAKEFAGQDPVAKNTDTSFYVVVNDGHGMINSKKMEVYINVEPTIITDMLPDAIEGTDYNPELLDSLRMIRFFDANINQDHDFELVYPDDYYDDPNDILPDQIPRDPCFPDADPTNVWDITDMKTTPAWLKINKESGLLYGTPDVTDAPKYEKVTVICRDEDGLMAVKQFDLFVDSISHNPQIWMKADNDCIDEGTNYRDTLFLYDYGLFRTGETETGETVTDTLYLTVLEPAGVTLSENTIVGPRSKDDEEAQNGIPVIIQGDNFDTSIADPNGRITIRIEVRDAAGNTRVLEYTVKVSDPVDFACPIKVENSKGAYRMLTFGTGRNATNGDGTVGDTIGQIDYAYCEHELPPVPEDDVFDSRWTISNRNGMLRNIFLTQLDDSFEGHSIYRASFQSGGESGITSNHFPIKITWDTEDIPAIDNGDANPSKATWWISDNQSNGQFFSYNMKTGGGSSVSDITTEMNGTEVTITIQKHDMDGFIIYYDWISDVNTQASNYAFGINSVKPNPVIDQTTVTYTLKQRSNVRFELVDNLGKVIGVVHQATNQPANTYTFELNVSEIEASGSYSLRMVAEGKASTEQIVIIK